MQVIVKKLTNVSHMRQACSFTSGKDSKCSLTDRYRDEHSPIRTQIFSVELIDVKSFVSVHFARHGKFAEHFILSKRDDRTDEAVDRNTLVNQMFLTNAQELIQMARKRLCGKAHAATRVVMKLIVEAVREVDPELAPFMVPECVYRGNICHESKQCNLFLNKVKHWKDLQ